MSEIMLHGVLNMPPEIWNNDSPIDVMQRHGRYVQASKYIHELETELAAVTEQRDEWKSKYIQQNKDLGCEMMDPNGTIWDYAKKLQTELAAAREEIDMMGIRYAAAEMHHANNMQEVTEQRDEAIIKYTGEANEFERQRNHAIAKCEDARRERDEAREQRDRLAEALKQIQGVGLVAVDAFDELDRIGEIATEARQSLNEPQQ